MMRKLQALLAAPLLFALGAGLPASADRPHDGALGMQPPATPIMREIEGFHNLLLPIIFAIGLLVLALLVWVMVRYNARANPTPQKFSHNTLVEVVWTGVPILILLMIAVPSFRLLYNQDVLPDGKSVYSRKEGVIPAPSMTIKATGRQWLWGYEYPDNGGFQYFSVLAPKGTVPDEDYLLRVDNPVVAPSGTTVRLVVTGADVIHSWAMPAFGLKIDAIPGRLNEGWFRVDQPGTYFGQCSELCGVDHAFMPIQVEIVSPETFAKWSAAKTAGDDQGAAQIVAEYKSELAGETRLAAAH